MRTNIILAVAVIATILLTYNLMDKDYATKQITIDSGLGVQEKLDKLTDVLQSYQKINQQQVSQAQQEQAQLKGILAELDARLGFLESEVTEQSKGVGKSNSDELDAETNLSSDNVESSQAKIISEADLGHWLDETLDAGNLDWSHSAQASEQATISLEKLPGVMLENMQCGDRFCRATLAHENGKQPDITKLIGEPPFINDGFTISEPDGRVSIYFAGNGISLEDLRSDAHGAEEVVQ